MHVFVCKEKIKTTLLQSLSGKNFSALEPSVAKYFSAVGCLHSLSEAVNFASLSFFRLICHYHFALPPIPIKVNKTDDII